MGHAPRKIQADRVARTRRMIIETTTIALKTAMYSQKSAMKGVSQGGHHRKSIQASHLMERWSHT